MGTVADYLQCDESTVKQRKSHHVERRLAIHLSQRFPACTSTQRGALVCARSLQEDTYTTLIYTLHIKRASSYYLFSIEIPCICIALLSFVVFWLDVTECGERLGFGVVRPLLL